MAGQGTKPHGVIHHPSAKTGFDRDSLGEGRTMSKKGQERKRKLKRESTPPSTEAHCTHSVIRSRIKLRLPKV